MNYERVLGQNAPANKMHSRRVLACQPLQEGLPKEVSRRASRVWFFVYRDARLIP